MNFNDTPEEAKFRAEVREWLEANARKRGPSDATRSSREEFSGTLARAREFQGKKAARGYAAITWPVELGGLGGTRIQQLIYNQEQAGYVANDRPFSVGLGMCIPTVVKFGTDAHRARYVRPALAGEEIWCQLFSEPAGGSDVAAARASAVREGDHWIVNGQKTWTSCAHYSDFGIVLTRTDKTARKHDGLTMFILDMKSPGVDVRPIRQMTGDSDFNEVFFNNVRIPDSNRLGAIGGGWKVAVTTLMHERASVGGGEAGGFVGWRDLLEIAKGNTISGHPADRDNRVRERVAQCWVNDFAKKLIGYRAQTALSRGQTPGPEQSVLKLLHTAKPQELSYWMMDILDVGGSLTHDELGHAWKRVEHSWTWGAAMRIAGGTDEILKNIIAERVLGLPQDARVDKDVPFDSLAV